MPASCATQNGANTPAGAVQFTVSAIGAGRAVAPRRARPSVWPRPPAPRRPTSPAPTAAGAVVERGPRTARGALGRRTRSARRHQHCHRQRDHHARPPRAAERPSDGNATSPSRHRMSPQMRLRSARPTGSPRSRWGGQGFQFHAAWHRHRPHSCAGKGAGGRGHRARPAVRRAPGGTIPGPCRGDRKRRTGCRARSRSSARSPAGSRITPSGPRRAPPAPCSPGAPCGRAGCPGRRSPDARRAVGHGALPDPGHLVLPGDVAPTRQCRRGAPDSSYCHRSPHVGLRSGGSRRGACR